MQKSYRYILKYIMIHKKIAVFYDNKGFKRLYCLLLTLRPLEELGRYSR
jgi:hypothetical protein